MKIRVNQNVHDAQIYELGFVFDRYERSGVEIYRDDVGNSLHVSRQDLIISIYSKSAGATVKELEITPQPYKDRPWADPVNKQRYQEEDAQNRADDIEREKALSDAWSKLLASLPPSDECPRETHSVVRRASELLQRTVVYLDYTWDSEYHDDRGKAQDAVDAIEALIPKANISDLLKLIARLPPP